MRWTAPPTFTPGQVVTATDLNTYLRDNPNYLYARPNSSIKRVNGSDYTTSSSTFVDIDGTNLSITLTLTGAAVLVCFTANIPSAFGGNGAFDVVVDGVRYANATDGLFYAGYTSGWV